MVTAADGAEEFYQTMNNTARSEDLKEALSLDSKLQQAWKMHENFYIVDNNGEGFDQKIKRAENYILKTLGMPVSTDFHKKFSVRNPNGLFFQYMIKEYFAEEFEIIDTFLENKEKSTIYLRKRVRQFLLTIFKKIF